MKHRISQAIRRMLGINDLTEAMRLSVQLGILQMQTMQDLLAEVKATRGSVESLSTYVAGLKQKIFDVLAGSMSAQQQNDISAVFAEAEATKSAAEAAINSGPAIVWPSDQPGAAQAATGSPIVPPAVDSNAPPVTSAPPAVPPAVDPAAPPVPPAGPTNPPATGVQGMGQPAVPPDGATS